MYQRHGTARRRLPEDTPRMPRRKKIRPLTTYGSPPCVARPPSTPISSRGGHDAHAALDRHPLEPPGHLVTGALEQHGELRDERS